MGKKLWGIAFCLAASLLAGLLTAPLTASAAGAAAERSFFILPVAAQTPMEAQMLGEKPLPPQAPALIPGAVRVGEESAKIRLPYNLELGISFRYHQDPAFEPSRRPQSSMLFNSSMDYRLLPNLKVGFHGYLYRYDTQGFAFPRGLGDTTMGLGPALKYDLGRWSFILKSQMQTDRERGDAGLENWFRVWYAF
ncbi:MAG: hypothetical protein FJ134_03945 [Deltaproteobacteria bacterium]|nr:hypothetical protein [Deltaproteobacteria bacterium]